mgnify:CR=1 FL=1
MPRVVPLSERKIKPPDDPTIMVDGVPKISVNASKKEIAEFLKIHKKLHNKKVGVYGYREGPSGKSLRKTSEQLRVDLISGGHMIGEAVSKKNPSRRGPSTAPANIAAKEAKAKQISEIKLNGWTSEPVQTAPDPAVINMSGYGGLPVPATLTLPQSFVGIPYVTRDPTEEELAYFKSNLQAKFDARDETPESKALFVKKWNALQAEYGQPLTLEPIEIAEQEAAEQEPEPAPDDEDDFEFPESDGWAATEVTLPPAVADSIAPTLTKAQEIIRDQLTNEELDEVARNNGYSALFKENNFEEPPPTKGKSIIHRDRPPSIRMYKVRYQDGIRQLEMEETEEMLGQLKGATWEERQERIEIRNERLAERLQQKKEIEDASYRAEAEPLEKSGERNMSETGFEGITYWENEILGRMTGKVYSDEDGKNYVGDWGEDEEYIIWKNDAERLAHEARIDPRYREAYAEQRATRGNKELEKELRPKATAAGIAAAIEAGIVTRGRLRRSEKYEGIYYYLDEDDNVFRDKLGKILVGTWDEVNWAVRADLNKAKMPIPDGVVDFTVPYAEEYHNTLPNRVLSEIITDAHGNTSYRR